MLDDLDKELEQRGLRFVRYADDCNIYVASERAAERVMVSVTRLLTEKLSLKVNERKSNVNRSWRLKILGFSFYRRKGVRMRAAHKALDRFRSKVRRLTRRTRHGQLRQVIQELNQYTMGWIGYFRLSDARSVFEELDEWIRRRLQWGLSNAFWQQQGLRSITGR